jgi:predicted nucleic acid-binding protein
LSFLLDTNVLSELVRPEPDANVVNWLAGLDERDMYMSVVSVAEIRRGIEQLSSGRRRTRLLEWLENELVDRFEDRVVEIDRRIATAWGVLMRRAEAAGLPSSVMDGFFAASAVVHGFTIATRDTRDFAGFGIALLDPWQEAAGR